MAETSSPRVALRPDDDTKVYLSVSKVRLWTCSTREAFYVSSVACCPGCHGSVHRLSAFDSVGTIALYLFTGTLLAGRGAGDWPFERETV